MRHPALEAVRSKQLLLLQVRADLADLLVRQPIGDQRTPGRGAGGSVCAQRRVGRMWDQQGVAAT
jgi:hypothetical protein